MPCSDGCRNKALSSIHVEGKGQSLLTSHNLAQTHSQNLPWNATSPKARNIRVLHDPRVGWNRHSYGLIMIKAVDWRFGFSSQLSLASCVAWDFFFASVFHLQNLNKQTRWTKQITAVSYLGQRLSLSVCIEPYCIGPYLSSHSISLYQWGHQAQLLSTRCCAYLTMLPS